MPLERYERLDPERRRLLLEAAVAEFVDKGYEAASLNVILEKSGLGKSSYYYYFEDKGDLYATVFEDALRRMEAQAPLPRVESLKRRTFWPAIEAWIHASVRVLARSPDFMGLSRDLQRLWRSPPARLKAFVEKSRQVTCSMLARGQALGCIRDDVSVEWLVTVTTAADWALDDLFMRRGPPMSELEDHVQLALDTFKRLVEPRGRKGRRK